MPKKATMIIHSGDMDKAYAALIIGTGAASMGMDVTLFFTFWGLDLLTKGGLEKAGLSKMNMAGLGKAYMKRKMDAQNVASLDQLMNDARELGVNIVACEMTMGVMGVSEDELIDGVEIGGVGAYLNEAKDGNINLFI